ncbi:high-affinity choline transporter 1-like [Haemaphysalis longicornis]
MTTFSGISWPVYFQRVFRYESVFSAKLMSYLSAIGCIGLALPPAIIGPASKSTNFTATGYPVPFNLLDAHRGNVLPYAMHNFTRRVPSFVGLLAITAAALSSMDFCLLSAGTLSTRNVYEFVLRPEALDLKMCATLRTVIFGVAIVATGAALRVQSVLDLSIFSSDLASVLLLLQFFTVLPALTL